MNLCQEAQFCDARRIPTDVLYSSNYLEAGLVDKRMLKFV